MPTVTFYKTNMNRSNRAYDGAALSSLLATVPSLSVEVGKQVIPNTPFAIYMNDDTTGQDIILSGYDYITYDYAGKTWYAFIDNIQPLATAEGQLFISSTIDKWAMCLVYYSDTFKLRGSLERAHVNDLEPASSYYTITLKNTTGAAEAPFNSALTKLGRGIKDYPSISQASGSIPYLYCYVYISNANTALTTYQTDITATNRVAIGLADYDLGYLGQTHNGANTLVSSVTSGNYLDNSMGITACYFAVPTKYILDLAEASSSIGTGAAELSRYLRGSWTLLMPNRIYNASSDTWTANGYRIQPLADLTAEGITSILLSPIPPYNSFAGSRTYVSLTLLNTGGTNIDISSYNIAAYLPCVNGLSVTDPAITAGTDAADNWTFIFSSTEDGNTEAKTGYPSVLNIPRVFSPSLIATSWEGTPPVQQRVSTTTDYATYLQRIPKYLTTVYHPMYVDGHFVNNTYLLPTNTIYTQTYWSLSLDLTQIIYYVDSDEMFEGKKVFSKPVLGGFTNSATLDYWTRLNATQSTISATKKQINSIVAPIQSFARTGASAMRSLFRGIGGNVLGTARALNATGENALGAAASIANTSLDIESANNSRRIAQYQYQTGSTEEGVSVGASNLCNAEDFCLVTWEDNTASQETICLNLHRYGYNTFLPIDEVYANHKRVYFNYFKGVDVSCSGLPQDWCDEIAEMFNSGVTLWQNGATVQEYEVCNYQEDL